MVTTAQPSRTTKPKTEMSPLKRWLLAGYVKEPGGPFEREKEHHRHHAWYKVMCLTGVDYFSTLGYQPVSHSLRPALSRLWRLIILVLLTLLGALPIYRRVAEESPHGEGSISMLAKLLSWWKGKLFILVLLGFVATDFIITITLSQQRTAHIVENPLVHDLLLGFRPTAVNVVITLGLSRFFRASSSKASRRPSESPSYLSSPTSCLTWSSLV